MRVVLVILIALSLLHPAIASASTVTVRPDPDAVPSDSPNSPPFADEVL